MVMLNKWRIRRLRREIKVRIARPDCERPRLWSTSTDFDASLLPICIELVQFSATRSTSSPDSRSSWDVSADQRMWEFHLRHRNFETTAWPQADAAVPGQRHQVHVLPDAL